MIRGTVRPAQDDGPGLEARIVIDIVGSSGIFQPVEVVVDTGFAGWMSLPARIVFELGLEYRGNRPVTLADGRQYPNDTHLPSRPALARPAP